ncbi:MAG: hypothetical protein GY841_22345 [FCB group bacterium]|nr:hypothetical protein [FCB group bacterium]
MAISSSFAFRRWCRESTDSGRAKDESSSSSFTSRLPRRPALAGRPPPTKEDEFFLVHWKGFPKSSRTWEPRQALLEDVPDHVHAFEKLH